MDAFTRLLAPFDIDFFLREVWGRRTLHLTGSPERLGSLPGLAELPALLLGRLTPEGWMRTARSSMTASYIAADGRARSLGQVPLHLADSLYNAGCSLCISALHRHAPALAELVASVEQHTDLGGGVLVNGYLTPPRSGSNMHYDSQHVFFCQVSGRKRWRFSLQPVMPDPPGNGDERLLELAAVRRFLEQHDIAIHAPDAATLDEVVLAPGDALYLPPGYWHQARTDDEHSLHFTLTLVPISFWTLLLPLLKRLVLENSAWRADLRFGEALAPELSETRLDAYLARLRAAFAQITARDLAHGFAGRAVLDVLFPGPEGR